MKRKKAKFRFKHVILAVCVTALAGFLAACGAEEETPEVPVTVTFMNGEEALGSVETVQGATLNAADYEAYETVDGTEFLGWFKTPGYLEVSKTDPATDVFEEDTTLYGCFRSLVVTEDTRTWYIVGSSNYEGPLKDSAWADANVRPQLREAVQLTLTGNAVNEFAITMDLYEGDLFQLVHDWGWDGQIGFGFLTEYDESCFENGGGLSGSAKTSNIKVLADGNYTLTLTTNPDDEALTTFTIVRNGDPVSAAEAVEEEPFVITETTGVKVKGSWVADWSELKDLTAEGDGIFTIEMELEAGTELYFSVFDGETDTGKGMKAENVTDEASLALLDEADNVKVTEAGTYVFTADLNTFTITVVKK